MTRVVAVRRPLVRTALVLGLLLAQTTQASHVRADDLADQAELEFSLGADYY
ncbi:MAG: hypothetical protein ABIQ16_28375 [Polyangiaceae bacterium]